MHVRSLKEAGYDPGKYYLAETEARRRFTDKLGEGVEGIAAGLTKEISGTVKKKKAEERADASQLAQLNELYSVGIAAAEGVDKDMRENTGTGLFETDGVSNSREWFDQLIGPKPPLGASREEMQQYMKKLNTETSAIINALIQKGYLSSEAYVNLAGKLQQLGIDPTTGQKAAQTREGVESFHKGVKVPGSREIDLEGQAIGPKSPDKYRGYGSIEEAEAAARKLGVEGEAGVQEAIGRRTTMQAASGMRGAETSSQAYEQGLTATGGRPLGEAGKIAAAKLTELQLKREERLSAADATKDDLMDLRWQQLYLAKKKADAEIATDLDSTENDIVFTNTRIDSVLRQAQKERTDMDHPDKGIWNELTESYDRPTPLQQKEADERIAKLKIFQSKLNETLAGIERRKKEAQKHPKGNSNLSPSSSPEQQQTKIVNGVTYVKESDGLWHKR